MYLEDLVEVHAVQVFIKNTVGASREVYGRIVIDDLEKDGGMRLFNAPDKQHAQALSPDGFLSLSGPKRCIVAGNCGIGVFLQEKQTDVEICNGYTYFDQVEYQVDVNRPITIVLPGDHGFARLHFSIFTKSIKALVRVAFVPHRPSEYTVFGEASVEYSSYVYPSQNYERYYKTRLFEVPKEKAMKMVLQNVGPLASQAVCAPRSGRLGIATKLLVNDSENLSDTLFFLPREKGEDTQHIKGNLADIQVSVTWGHQVFALLEDGI